jgi:hypothetical protein
VCLKSREILRTTLDALPKSLYFLPLALSINVTLLKLTLRARQVSNMSSRPPLYSAEQVEEMKSHNAGVTPAGSKTRSRGTRVAVRSINRSLASGFTPTTPRGSYGSGGTTARSSSQRNSGFGGAPAQFVEAAKTLGGYNTIATSGHPATQHVADFGSGFLAAQPNVASQALVGCGGKCALNSLSHMD